VNLGAAPGAPVGAGAAVPVDPVDSVDSVHTVLVFEGQGAREVPGDPPLDLTAVTPAVAQAAIVRHQVERAGGEEPEKAAVRRKRQLRADLHHLALIDALDRRCGLRRKGRGAARERNPEPQARRNPH